MFKSMSPKRRQKRLQRIVFGIVIAVLSFGLIGSSVVWSGLGDNKQQQADVPRTLAERINVLEEQSAKNPKDKGLLTSLASYYAQAGKTQQAEETYQKILTLDSKDIYARQDLALLYYAQGKTADAEKQLQEALKVKPDNPGVNFQYAKLLADKKDYNGAIAAMEKVLEAQETGPQAEEARKSIETWKAQAGQ